MYLGTSDVNRLHRHCDGNAPSRVNYMMVVERVYNSKRLSASHQPGRSSCASEVNGFNSKRRNFCEDGLDNLNISRYKRNEQDILP